MTSWVKVVWFAIASSCVTLPVVHVTPACVVLDLHMPKVSGFEVQARMAESGLRIPVIVITGHDSPEARARALGGGAAAYLCKPLDGLALRETIQTAVVGRPATNGRATR